MFQRTLSRTTKALSGPAVQSRTQQISRTSLPSQVAAQSRPRNITASRSRFYSAEAEPAKTDSAAPPADAKAEADKEDPVKKELEAKKKEVIDVTDKWKRSIAEYRNLQQQTKREVQAAKDFALQRFAKDLIDSVDNLDRALTTVPEDKLTADNQDLKNLHDGIKMTETILMQTLKKHGLERFDPSEAGDKFDPNRHEATFQVPQPDKPDNTVFHTQQKGFALNGRVLRAAKVGVVKNS